MGLNRTIVELKYDRNNLFSFETLRLNRTK